MAVLKCKMCGGDLNIIEGVSTAECEFCGSIQTIPKVDDEKKLTLFARANRLRAACEFDKAAGIYEAIVADFPEEAEAYWGLVLCRYGIEYVDDPGNGKKIPTCHRSSFDSIMEDSDFEQALENADVMARRVYREEAKQIEELRKGIIAVSNNEEPYDIFICYKETDENGERTLDSVLAQDVYEALTDKGYRVFFSRITLEDKLGMEYEPYIFAALNSAKIMLAFGTDYEYFNAVWVKNEWGRFLKLMEKDKQKYLIPCYKGIDAYDMPKEFARLQAQDMGKIGAMQDLLRGIGKLMPKQEQEPVVVQTAMPNASAMVMRGQFALEDGEWEKAAEFFEKALDQNPQDGGAYLGKVLASLHLQNAQQIDDYLVIIHEDKDYDRAVRFTDPQTSKELAAIRERAHRKYLIKCLAVGLKRVGSIKERQEAQKQHEERERQEQLHREEEEQRRKEESRHRAEALSPVRNSLAKAQGLISAGQYHTVGVKSDGRVVVGFNNRINVNCNVSDWTDIVAVSAQKVHTVGLRANGTVVAVGDNSDGECDVSGWRNIVAISATTSDTIGLRANGTVVLTGNQAFQKYDLSGWKNIVAISAGDLHIVGLRSDGTVAAEAYRGRMDQKCNVSGWTDMVAISASHTHTVGLKSDGTVAVAGYNSCGECDTSNWTDIVAISAGYRYTVGLKANGTVVAVGDNSDGKCDVSGWTDIVSISAGFAHTVGLRSDGTVVAVGNKEYDKCKVSGWKLFESFAGLEQERRDIAEEKRKAEEWKIKERRKAEERKIEEMRKAQARQNQQAAWRNSGKCQHCGGDLKGFFSKKCTACGKPKDY